MKGERFKLKKLKKLKSQKIDKSIFQTPDERLELSTLGFHMTETVLKGPRANQLCQPGWCLLCLMTVRLC